MPALKHIANRVTPGWPLCRVPARSRLLMVVTFDVGWPGEDVLGSGGELARFDADVTGDELVGVLEFAEGREGVGGHGA